MTEGCLRPAQLPRQRVGEDTLVFCPAGGVCTLNGTALELVSLCDGTRSPAEVVAVFVALYPGEEASALADQAQQTLADLLRHGVLTTGEEPPEAPA